MKLSVEEIVKSVFILDPTIAIILERKAQEAGMSFQTSRRFAEIAISYVTDWALKNFHDDFLYQSISAQAIRDAQISESKSGVE